MNSVITAIGSTGVIEIFNGAPAGKTAGTFNADPGTRLASLALSATAAPNASAGVSTYNTITSATALAGGTPASYRIKTVAAGGVGTVVEEGDAAVGSGTLNFNSTIGSGGTVTITSAVFTEGNP